MALAASGLGTRASRNVLEVISGSIATRFPGAAVALNDAVADPVTLRRHPILGGASTTEYLTRLSTRESRALLVAIADVMGIHIACGGHFFPSPRNSKSVLKLELPSLSFGPTAALSVSRGGAASAAGPASDDAADPEVVCEIPGDGNCLFRAIAHQLYLLGIRAIGPDGTEEDYTHEILRALVVSHVHEHPDVEGFLTDAERGELRLLGGWAGEESLQVLAQLLSVNMEIHREGAALTTVHPPGREPGLPTLRLSYNGVHYNSIARASQLDEMHLPVFSALAKNWLSDTDLEVIEELLNADDFASLYHNFEESMRTLMQELCDSMYTLNKDGSRSFNCGNFSLIMAKILIGIFTILGTADNYTLTNSNSLLNMVCNTLVNIILNMRDVPNDIVQGILAAGSEIRKLWSAHQHGRLQGSDIGTFLYKTGCVALAAALSIPPGALDAEGTIVGSARLGRDLMSGPLGFFNWVGAVILIMLYTGPLSRMMLPEAGDRHLNLIGYWLEGLQKSLLVQNSSALNQEFFHLLGDIDFTDSASFAETLRKAYEEREARFPGLAKTAPSAIVELGCRFSFDIGNLAAAWKSDSPWKILSEGTVAVCTDVVPYAIMPLAMMALGASTGEGLHKMLDFPNSSVLGAIGIFSETLFLVSSTVSFLRYGFALINRLANEIREGNMCQATATAVTLAAMLGLSYLTISTILRQASAAGSGGGPEGEAVVTTIAIATGAYAANAGAVTPPAEGVVDGIRRANGVASRHDAAHLITQRCMALIKRYLKATQTDVKSESMARLLGDKAATRTQQQTFGTGARVAVDPELGFVTADLDAKPAPQTVRSMTASSAAAHVDSDSLAASSLGAAMPATVPGFQPAEVAALVPPRGPKVFLARLQEPGHQRQPVNIMITLPDGSTKKIDRLGGLDLDEIAYAGRDQATIDRAHPRHTAALEVVKGSGDDPQDAPSYLSRAFECCTAFLCCSWSSRRRDSTRTGKADLGKRRTARVGGSVAGQGHPDLESSH